LATLVQKTNPDFCGGVVIINDVQYDTTGCVHSADLADCDYFAFGTMLMAADSASVRVGVPLVTGEIDAGDSNIVTRGAVLAGTVTATTTVTSPRVQATTHVQTPLLLGAESDPDTIAVGSDSAFTLKRADATSGDGTDFVIEGQAGATAADNGGDLVLKPGAAADASCVSTASADAVGDVDYDACAAVTALDDDTACLAVQLGGVPDAGSACTYTARGAAGSIIFADSAGTAVVTVGAAGVTIAQPLTAQAVSSTSTLTTTGTITANAVTVAGRTQAETLVASTSITTPSIRPVANRLDMGGDAAFVLSKPEHSDGQCTVPAGLDNGLYASVHGVTATCAATDAAACGALTGQASCEDAADNLACTWDDVAAVCAATDLAACAAVAVEATEATCEDAGKCTHNNVVPIPALLTQYLSGQSLSSRHGCELFDVINADAAASPRQPRTPTHTFSSSQCLDDGSNAVSYSALCALFPGFDFREQGGVEKCFDFRNTGGDDTTGFTSYETVCLTQHTGRSWTDGSGTDLVIQGQDAGGTADADGGDVVLRPGTAAAGGAEGSVKFQDSVGSTIMEVSKRTGVGTVTIPTGKYLNVAGTLESAGTYVAEPASAIVSINAHGDAISGPKVLDSQGNLGYAPISREFVVIKCDNLNADMRDVLNPVFPKGMNGQIVHVVNIGEDYCQMQRGGPSQATYDAKFRLIGDANKVCLKSSADGGGIISFMYYYAEGVGGWQQITPGPADC
jgi:hypothetical protein